MPNLDEILRERFHQKVFRPCQRQAIQAIIKKEDVFVLLPTGYGKSLCYQLPVIADGGGFTIVVSPLLALMQDQVGQLRDLGIPACAFNSNLSPAHRKAILDACLRGEQTGLIYISPELVLTPTIKLFLQKANELNLLNRIVIDEVHCCVEWGYGFREDYAKLGELRFLQGVPWVILTATASIAMRRQIMETLRLSSPRLIVAPASRPNLHFEVRYVENREDRLVDMLRLLKTYRRRLRAWYPRKTINSTPFPGSGIVYCRRRIDTENLATELRRAKFNAHPFHAHMPTTSRMKILKNWVAGNPEYAIVVATTAFGMGVDKPDTRFVIHFDMPPTLDSLVQQSGRAGRDGRAARTLLYCSEAELRFVSAAAAKLAHPSGRQAVEALINYAKTTSKCRHALLATYFNDGPDTIKCDYACDYCRSPERLKRRVEKWTNSLE